jgi:O-antigen ligase
MLFGIILTQTETTLNEQTSYFVLSTICILLSSVFILLFKKSYLKLSILDYLIFALFIYIAINYLFISPVDASSKFLQTIYLLIIYFSLRIILASFKKIFWFIFLIIAIIGLIEAILGINQVLGINHSNHNLFVTTGTFFNPGPYGGLISIIMALTFYFNIHYYNFYIYTLKKIKKNIVLLFKSPFVVIYSISLASFMISYIIFFAIMSRAAIISFAICFIIILLREYKFKILIRRVFNRKYYKTLVIVFIVISFSTLLTAGYYLKKDSADGRLHIWSVSSTIIHKKPFFGTGYGGFAGEFASNQAEYFNKYPDSVRKNTAGVPEYGFNEYIQICSELGFTGLLLVLLILGISLYKLYIKKNLFSFGLIALIVFSFFSYPFSILPLQILLMFFIALGASIEFRKTVNHSFYINNKMMIIPFYILLILIYVTTVEVYKEKINANITWKNFRFIYNGQDYIKTTHKYATLYPLLKDNYRFLFEYGHALNKIGQYKKSNDILMEGAPLSSDPMFYNIIGNNYLMLHEYRHAEDSYKKAFNILPNRLYPLYLLMKLYITINDTNEAVKMAEKIISFKVKVKSYATTDMKTEAKDIILKYKKK